MEQRATLLVLAFLVAGAIAGPLNARNRQKCSRTCTDSTKFNYIQGTTYTYRYQGEVITKVKGASDEHSGMFMGATTQIEVLDKCDFALKLSDVTLEESDPRDESRRSAAPNSNEFRRALEQNAMHFSFQDGRIDEVCGDEDPTWVANIKKAILSSFQNTMDDLQIDTKVSEVDVTGQCDTEYKVAKKGWRSFTVTKSKDMQTCTDRHGYRTALQSTHYRVPTKIQSLPITKGSHKCTQTYHSSGRMLKAECVESHVFRPFSKESSGAVTDARHSLEFIRESVGVSERPTGGRRMTLKFEHEIPKTDKNSDIEPSLATLREICTQTSSSIRPETPALFARLVYQIKEIDERTLRDLHQRVSREQVCVSNHETAKKFLHDAIPMVGTTASVRMIADLINRKHVKDSEADAWLSSLAFVKNPTKDMISPVAALLQREPTKNVYLSVSAMVNTYCKTHSDCDRDVIIQGVAQALQARLNSNCQSKNPRDRETILIALKSLGNMGHATRVSDTLNRCMLETGNPIDIRLAAIDAFRRQPCDADRSRLMSVLTDTNEDVEVRIAAFLAVMQCASHDVLTAVQRMLEVEPVNQVGSFIWTYLTNIRETSDLHKQTIRRILEDQTLKKQFNLDKTKFSRNLEGSFFSDSLNAGAKVESNVVFTPKSYIPRSAMLNLTFDLFGESVNLLEVGGRVEGLERFVENYFGPKGYFGNSMKGARSKRSVPNDITSLHNKFADKFEENIKGTMYFKVFGHEINFVDLMALQKQASELNILEILIMLAKEHDINYNKNFMFLDTSMTIPTITGMPIKLSVNGTATVSLKVKGKLDMRKLGSSPRSLDVNGYFKPSAAVEVSSMMGVDAFVTRTGVKMVSTLHTSSEVTGKIMIKDSQVVQLKLDAPKDKVEILNAETKFFTLHRQAEREQKMLSANPVVKEKCTGAGLSKVLGVELCGHVQYPGQALTTETPFYPLTGPSKLSIGLQKTDAHTSYQFEAKMLTQKIRKNHHTKYNHVARLAFDTPGSSVNRKFDIDFELNRAERKIHFNMITPWKKAGLNGEIVNNPDEKRAALRFTIDDEQVYSVLTGVTIQRGSGFSKYTPNVEIRIPGRKTITVMGGLEHQEGRKLDIDLSMNNVLRDPVLFRGSIQKESRQNRERYNTDLELRSRILNAKLGGYVEKKNNGYRSRLALDYGKGRKPEHRLVLNYKMRQHVTPSLRRIVMDTAVQTTQFPDYSFATRVEVQKTAGHAEGNIGITYGSDPSNQLKKIDASGIFKYGDENGKFNLDTSMKFKYPMMKYDWDMKLYHNHEPNVVKTTAKVNNGQREMINFDMSLLDQSTDLRKYTADITLKIPSRDMRFYQLLEERQYNEYHHEMILQGARDKIMSSRSMYKREAGQHTLNVDVRMPDSMPISLNAQTNMNLRDFSATGSVSYQGKDYSANAFYKQDAERHIAGGKVIIPDMSPIIVNVDVKPTLNDMSLAASTEFAEKVYRITAAYSALFDSTQVNVNGNVDVKYPGRRVTGAIAAKRTDGELGAKFDAKWDADRDTSKAMVFDVEYKYPTNTQHAARFTLRIPGKQLTGKASVQITGSNFKTAGELQWDRQSKMVLTTHFTTSRGWNSVNGGIQFTSPFKYAKRIGGSFSHDSRGKQYTTQGELVFNEQKITSEMFINAERANNFEGRFTTRTPFEICRLINLRLKHVRQNHHLSTIISGTVQDKTIHGEMMLKTANAIEGSAKIQLPIKYLENLGVTFYHHLSESQLTNRAELVWSPTEKISVYAVMRPESLMKVDGHFQLKTPFTSVEVFDIRLTHEINGKLLNSKAHGNLNGKVVEYEIVAKNNGNYYKRDIEGTIRMKSPFNRMEDIGMSIKYSDDGVMYTASADARWNPQSQITTSVMVNHRRSGYQINNEGTFHVKTPFKLREISSTWKHVISGSELVANHEFSVDGRKYTVAMDAKNEVTSTERNVALNLDLQCPHINPVKTNLKATIRGKSYVETTALVTINNERLIDMEAAVGIANMNINGNFKADLSRLINFKPISATLKTHFNSAPYTIQINGDNRYAVDASLDFSDINQIEGSVYFSSPAWEKLGLTISHKKQSNDRSTRVTVQWTQEKTITMFSKLTCRSTGVSGTFNVQTPFEVLRSVAIGFNHAGSRHLFTNTHNLDVTVNGQHLTVSNKVIYDGVTDMKASSRVRSNFVSYDTSFIHKYNAGQITTGFEFNPVSTNNKFEARLTVDTISDLKMSFVMKTPFEQMKYSALTISHTGNFPETVCSLTAETQTTAGKIAASGSFEIHGLRRIVASGHLTTPFSSLRDASLRNTYQREGDVHTFRAELTSLNKKYDVEATLNVGDKMSFTLKCPWVKEVKASLNKRGSFPYLTANAELTVDTTAEKASITGHFMINSFRSINANLDVNTPWTSAPVSVTFDHGKQNSLWATSLVAQTPSGKWQYNSKFQFTDVIEMNVDVKTPTTLLRSLSFEFKHDGSLTEFDHKFLFEYDVYYARVRLDSQLKVRSFKLINGHLKLTSPIRDWEHVAFVIDHSKRGDEWTSTVDFDYTPGRRIQLRSGLKLGQNMKMDLTLNTPFTNMRRTMLSINHNGDFWNYDNSVKFNMDGRRFDSVSTVSSSSQGRTMKGSIETGVYGKMWTYTIDQSSGLGFYNTEQRIKFNNQQHSEFLMNVDIRRDVKVYAKSSSVLHPTVMIDMEHKGNGFTFNNIIKTKFGSVEAESLLDVKSLRHITFRSEVNNLYPQKTVITYNHDLSETEWSMKIQYARGSSNRCGVSVLVNVQDNIDVALTVESPTRHLESIKIRMENRGNLDDFSHSMTVSYTGLTTANLETKFKLQGFRFAEGSVKTTGLFDVSANLNHRMSSTVKTTTFNVNANGQEYLRIASGLTMGSGVQYTMTVNGPCRFIKNVRFQFDFSGEASAFNTKLSMSHNMLSKPMMMEVNFKAPLEGSLKLNGIFVRDISANILHSSTATTKATTFSILTNGAEYVAIKSQLKLESGVHYVMTLNGPCRWVKNVRVEYDFSGDASSFNTKLSMKHSMTEPLTAELDFSKNSGVRTTFTMNGPCRYTKNVRLHFDFSGDASSFNTKLSMKHSMTEPLTAELDFSKNSGVRTTFTMNGPCRYTKNVRLHFVFSGDASVFNTKASLSHGMLPKPMKAELDFKTPLDMKLLVNPPCSVERIEFTIKNQNRGYRRYSTVMTYTYNQNTMRLSSEMSLTRLNDMNGEITFTSSFDTMKLNFNHRTLDNDIQSVVSYESRAFGKYEATATLQPVKGRFAIKTPIAGYEEIGFAYDHQGKASRFTNEINLFKSGKTISLKSEFSSFPTISAKVYLTTPFRNWEKTGFTLTHTHDATNAKTDLFMSAYNRDISLSYTHRLESNKEVQLTIRTPFVGYENMYYYVKHSGDMTRFDTTVTIQYKNGKRIEATVGFSRVDFSTLRFDLTMKTPCPWMKMTKISYNHQALSGNSFKCNALVQNNGKTVDGELTVKLDNEVDVRLVVKTPFAGYERLRLAVNHRGDLSRFNTNIGIKYMTNKKIELEVAHTAYSMKKVETTIAMKSPCKYVKNLKLTYKHTLEDNSFTMHTEQSLMHQKVSTDLLIKLTPNFETSLKIATPFVGYEKMSLTVNHNGKMNRFSTNARVEYGEKSIESTITFLNMDMRRVELTIDSKTPFSQMRTSSLTYKHQGDLSNLEVNAKLTKNGKAIIGNLNFKRNPAEVRVVVNTPFSKYEELSFTYDHQQHDASRGTCRATVQYQTGKRIEASMTFKNNGLNDLELKIDAKTPMISDASLSFASRGDRYGLHITTKLVGRGKEVSGELTFTKKPFTLDLTVKTPFIQFEELYVRASHYPVRKMASASVQYMTGKLITASGIFTHDDQYTNVEADITLKHPFTAMSSEIKTSYKHQIEQDTIDVTTKVKYGFNKNFNVHAKLEMKDTLSGLIEVETPFYRFEKIQASFKHGGRANQFSSSLNVEYMTGQKIETLVVFSNVRSPSGSISVKTPFYGYEAMSARFDHQGDFNHFKTNVLLKYKIGKQIEATLDFTPTAAELSLKTPFHGYQYNTIKYEHTGYATNFRTTVTMSCMRRTLSALLEFSPKKSQLNINTPFNGYETIGVEYEFTGMATNFNVHSTIKAGRRMYNGRLLFTPSNFKLTVNTPHSGYETIVASGRFEGELNNFNVIALLINNRRTVTEVNIAFKAQPSIFGKMTLTTPYYGFEHVEIQFNHDGVPTNFKTSGSVQTRRLGRTEFELSFSPRQSVLKFKTPINGFGDVEVIHNVLGSPSNFKANAMMKFRSNVLVQAELAFSLTEANLRIKTPVAGFERMAIFYRLTGDLSRFQAVCNVEFMTGKRISADINYQPREVKITARTPFTGFESLAAYSKFDGSKIDAYVQYQAGKRISATGQFNKSPLTITAEVKTPFQGFETVSATFSSQGPLTNLKCRSSVQYKTGRRIDGRFQMMLKPNRAEVTVSVFSPFNSAPETTLDVKFDATKSEEMGAVTLKYGNGKVIRSQLDFSTENGYSGSLLTTTPFAGFEELYAGFTHTGPINRFATNLKLKYATNKVIGATVNVFADDAKQVTIDFQLTSPCPYLQKTGVTYRHSINNNMVYVNLKVGDIVALVKVSKDSSVVGHIDFQTPFEIIKRAGIYVGGQGQLKKSNGLVKMYYNSHFIKVDAKYDIESLNNLQVSGTIESSVLKRPVLVSVNHKGHLRSFVTALVIDNVKADVEFNHASATTGKLTLLFSDRKIVMNFNHQGPWKHFTTEAAVKCNEHTVSGRIDFSKSRRNLISNMNVKTSFSGWEETAVTVRHQGGITEFRSRANLQMTGKEDTALQVTYKHGEEGLITLKSPFYKFQVANARFNKINSGYEGSVSWAPYKTIEGSISGEFTYNSISDLKYDAQIHVVTPFEAVRNININSKHNHGTNNAKNSLRLAVNNEVYVETSIEGEITTTGFTGNTKMVAPHPLEVTVKIVATNAEKSAQAKVNWDTTAADRTVEILAQYKDSSNYYRTKHDGIIKVTLPWRTSAVTTTLESSKYQSVHKTELIWDQARGKKVSYGMTFRDRSRSYQRQWEADLILSSPVRTMKTVFNHNDNGRRFVSEVQLLWDASRNENKKMGIKTIYENYGLSHKLEVTFNHPKMSKDLTVRGELTLNRNNFVYSGKTEVEYSMDPSAKLVVSGKLNKIARGTANNYTMSMHVSHPKSLIDMELNSHIGRSENKVSAGTEMKYLTARRVQKNIFLMGEIDKIKKTMNLHLHTPLKSFDMAGEMKVLQHGYRFDIANLINGEKKMNTEVEINTDKPSVDLRLRDSANRENMIHTYAKLNNNELKLELYRHINGLKTTDGLFAITRNTSRLFHSRVHWNQQMITDLTTFAKEKINEAHSETTEMMNEITRGVKDEMRVRSYYMRNNLPDMTEAREYLSSELASFKEDGDVIASEFKQMYENNHFFMRDIYETASNAYESMSNHIQVLTFQIRRQMESVRRAYSLKLAVYARRMDEIMADVRDYIVDVVLRFRPAWQKYAYAAIRQYLVASQKANHQYQQFMEKAQNYKDTVVNYLDDNFDFVTYRIEPYFAKIQELRAQLRSHLSEEQQDRYIDMAIQKLAGIVSSLRTTSRSWVGASLEKYSEIKNEVTRRVSERMEKVLGHELSQKAMRKIVTTYKQMEDLATHFEISHRVTKWAKKAFENGKDLLKDQVHEITKQYIQLDRSGFTVYSPEKGEIQGEVYLPLRMELNWDQLKNFNTDVLKEEAKRVYSQYLPKMDGDYSLWDTYYKYKPSSDISNWIPPYKAHASILGNEHYTTFDGKSFDFAGTCTYLLASDFVQSHFSILANYDRGVRKSITVLSNKKEIEIFHNGKVTVDGHQTELPYSHINTTITTTGDVITVDNALGVRVTCDLTNEMCTIGISGWFQGKTAGLLGTYDHEMSNDFMTSNKKVTTDLDTFARSWTIGSCSGYQNLARKDAQPAAEQSAICDQLFADRNSHFRPCYSMVNPGNYHRMCMKDISNIFGEYDVQKKACDVARLYQSECASQGVELALPKTCETCATGDKRLKNGEASQIDSIHSADVVFVIEEKQCNKAASRRLPHLVSQLDSALSAKGLRNNRFGLVGFGGKDIHDQPQRHTLMNQIMNDATKFRRAVSALTFVNGENNNVFAAIREAAKYPFRAGASKIIIAMPCESHSHDASAEGMSEYLAKNDITFHLLTGYDFTLKSRSPKSSFIFGADRRTAYTSKDVYQLQGDQALFNMLLLPKDKCVSLALNRQGSVFNSKKMTEGRVNTQKFFLDVFARRVAAFAQPSECQNCKCTNGRTECTPCASESVPIQALVPAEKTRRTRSIPEIQFQDA
ncbi:uncharacterized protein LOC141900764 [Tubulanus polymorphus]|uniref:uncharacterized protein LOC141900764 n=1 Tax=Tubulanus polymorphus TaxID=672921 RepID=UPI003DA600CC